MAPCGDDEVERGGPHAVEAAVRKIERDGSHSEAGEWARMNDLAEP